MTKIIYDCADLAVCAERGGSCFCRRRLASHAWLDWSKVHDVRDCGGGPVLEHQGVDLDIDNPPVPTFRDLLQAKGVRGI